MDKKTIIGIVVIVIIILLTPIYQKWVVGTVSTPTGTADSLSVTQTNIIGSGDTTRPVHTITESETTSSISYAKKNAEEDTAYQNIPVKDIVVVSDKFTIILSTLGGDVKSIKLHKIFDSSGDEVELVPNLTGGPNFEFLGVSGKKTFSTAGVRFVADKDTIMLTENDPKDAVTMLGNTPDGVMVQRRYEFEYGMFHFRQKIFVALPDSTQIIDDAAL